MERDLNGEWGVLLSGMIEPLMNRISILEARVAELEANAGLPSLSVAAAEDVASIERAKRLKADGDVAYRALSQEIKAALLPLISRPTAGT